MVENPKVGHYNKEVLRIVIRVLTTETLGTSNSEQPKICANEEQVRRLSIRWLSR
jgi:hypothetical protein